jgi:DNA-binding NarL/FixJ family response regulator
VASTDIWVASDILPIAAGTGMVVDAIDDLWRMQSPGADRHESCPFMGGVVSGGRPVGAENSVAVRVFLINGYRCILWGLERLIESRQPAMRAVGSATSCAEALEQIDDAAPDLILLDVDLGREDITEAIATLKSRSPANILVLTGSRNESLPEHAVLAGASGVVSKQSPAETILAAIAKVHQGELWLDRVTTGRVFAAIPQQRTARAPDLDQVKIASLTVREREIVALATNYPGASGEVLAQMLNISEHTLRNHLSSVYQKLDVSSRLTMSAFAYKHGLTSAPSPRQDGIKSDGRAGRR